MIAAIGSIATDQACMIEHTLKAIIQLLVNYAASNPDAVICYHASNMHLWIEGNGSYLSETRARSRVAGYHYLSNNPTSTKNKPLTHQLPLNGAITVPCQVMRTILASVAECEMAALFENGQEAVPEHITLAKRSHPQGPTPIATDNITDHGIANDFIKQKRSVILLRATLNTLIHYS